MVEGPEGAVQEMVSTVVKWEETLAVARESAGADTLLREVNEIVL